MSDSRKMELFENLLSWVWEHTENLFEYDDHYAFRTALENCEFTPEEIEEILKA